MSIFQIVSDFTPCGDQPQAIEKICSNFSKNINENVLLGITGSGKTFTMANIIQKRECPALILAPNKTLAAQLYSEFKELFPHNAVEYFVSYYDYYQPEAYLPITDTYIEKDSSINELIDKLRHSTTASLLKRKDVIVVASVSCIYGLGSPETYKEMHLLLEKNQEISRDKLIHQLINMQYDRNDIDFHRGTFRVRGDVVEIIPSIETEKSIRIEFFGDEIEALAYVDPLLGTTIEELKTVHIFPNSHYVTDKEELRPVIKSIQEELRERLSQLKQLNKVLESQRLEQRTYHDIEMIEEIGYCQGIENYSRHFDGRKEGEPPYTLFDYLPDDFIMFIDESHLSVPQIGAMYRGDRSRKMNLVEHGFRLPSALDNRPLQFKEFEKRVEKIVYVSATPGPYELEEKKAPVTEQIVRPTGLMDPVIIVKPAKGQVQNLVELCNGRIEKSECVLVTTLTKRMAEDLTDYLTQAGIKTRYLHSDIDTFERVAIIRSLRKREFDVLVGINLLREGLDLPEVSLVAILDADKEGFLRSKRALIQTFGRAARNINGQVVLYADRRTKAMHQAIEETENRRVIQAEYNKKHNITPQTIIKNISDALSPESMDYSDIEPEETKQEARFKTIKNLPAHINKLQIKMFKAAQKLDFEEAAKLRDEVEAIKQYQLMNE